MAFLKYASKQLTKIIDVCTSFEPEWLFGNRYNVLCMSDSKTNVQGGVMASAFLCFFGVLFVTHFHLFFVGDFWFCFFFPCSLLWLFFSGEARVWKVQAVFKICTDGNEGTSCENCSRIHFDLNGYVSVLGGTS